MNRTLWIGASGMAAQQLNLDTVAHDLANVNTVGFKSQRAEFSELIAQHLRLPGGATSTGEAAPIGLSVGLGARPAARRRDFSQGPLQETGAPLDLAVTGEGFHAVVLPSGDLAYTRTSTFQTDATGRIVDAAGRALDGDFTIPAEARNVSVTADGTVSVLVDGDTAPQVLGQVLLTRFVNPQGLESVGEGLFRATEASGDPVTAEPGTSGLGTIQQGFVEASNVSVVEEMVNMITAQCAYEMNARAVSAADSMLQVLNEVLR